MSDPDQTWPAVQAERLQGPEAGWETMHRNLAAYAVVTEAEMYANGSRRLTVIHGPDAGVEDLVDAVDQAAHTAGYNGGGTILSRTDRTSWTWPSTHAPAALIVQAAADQAHQLNPGHWHIEADDH